MIEITREVAEKVLWVVDQGLSDGLGIAEPGKMCVEAAVCYALGLPHGDDPGCVASSLRSLKIRLNDSNWSSNQARAKGLRRLAIAQLGSKGHLDEIEFRKRVVNLAITKSVPFALRAAASVQKDEKHKAALIEAANRCEKEASRESALEARVVARDAAAAAEADPAAAYAAAAATAAAAAASAAAAAAATATAATAYAAYTAATAAAAYAAYTAATASARDGFLSEYAEAIVQILIELKAPGCQWLELAGVELR